MSTTAATPPVGNDGLPTTLRDLVAYGGHELRLPLNSRLLILQVFLEPFHHLATHSCGLRNFLIEHRHQTAAALKRTTSAGVLNARQELERSNHRLRQDF